VALIRNRNVGNRCDLGGSELHGVLECSTKIAKLTINGRGAHLFLTELAVFFEIGSAKAGRLPVAEREPDIGVKALLDGLDVLAPLELQIRNVIVDDLIAIYRGFNGGFPVQSSPEEATIRPSSVALASGANCISRSWARFPLVSTFENRASLPQAATMSTAKARREASDGFCMSGEFLKNSQAA
jgi:hypothetical protein